MRDTNRTVAEADLLPPFSVSPFCSCRSLNLSPAWKAAPHPISGSGIEQAASPGAESRALCSEPGLHQDQPLTPAWHAGRPHPMAGFDAFQHSSASTAAPHDALVQ
ncbi:unnamed protein product [Caretta caretta]